MIVCVLQEAMKSLVNVIEIVGVQYTLQLTPNLSKFEHGVRVLALGTGLGSCDCVVFIELPCLGWAFAESVVSYLIPLWIGARGMQFSWEFIEMGVASNINMVSPIYCDMHCALP
jgi:hypothetical protein